MFSIPADQTGKAVGLIELARFGANSVLEDDVGVSPEVGAVELRLETDVRGTLLGPCDRCGAAVGDDDPLIGIWYLTSGRAGKGDRGAWRLASPALERGDNDSAAVIAKRAGGERRSEFLRQARAGARLLCWRCAVRLRHELIEPPKIPDAELDRQCLEPTERDKEHVGDDDADDDVALLALRGAPTRSK